MLLDLAEPPVVVAQGRGTHGVVRLTDQFQLPELWSLHLYGYAAELEVDGVSYPVTPGSVSLVPPASLIRYRYRGPSQHIYAHLRVPGPPADHEPADHEPADHDHGDHDHQADLASSRLALMMSPGADLPAVTDLMESAIASAAARPERTRADIWMVLLRLADRPHLVTPGSGAVPAQDYVVAAMSFIESRLAEPLSVPQIADAVGISHNHLTRVFSAQTRQTVVGYLRRRRIEHAQHLLARSTMSISAIAATVGIADLQAFNKTCRAITGQSPRQLRLGE